MPEQIVKQESKSLSQLAADDEKFYQNTTFYSKKHTWAKVTSNWTIQVGLTDFAIQHLKALAKIYTDDENSIVRILEPFGVAETWMFMFDLYSPVAGRIVKINRGVLENEGKLLAPDWRTWLIEVSPIDHNALIAELGLLLKEAGYKEYLEDVKKKILPKLGHLC